MEEIRYKFFIGTYQKAEEEEERCITNGRTNFEQKQSEHSN
jgi:hypothetical protein